jgi:hypothetical protein
MLVQEVLELGILEKLLTQQSTARSATRVEIEEDLLVFRPGLGHGFVEGALVPILGGRGRRHEQNQRRYGSDFLHGDLPLSLYESESRMSTDQLIPKIADGNRSR